MLFQVFMAVLAGVGVLIVFYAIAGSRQVDPVQARLSQLGSMQARTLEELELQQPLFERTLRPLATRLSGLAQRFASPQKVSRTEKLVLAALLSIGFFAFGLLTGSPAFGFIGAIALGVLGFFIPEIWLSRRIKK